MLPLPFLWLPQIGKCCRRRFASFPGLGRFADTVWEISQGLEHLLALSELFPNIGTDFLFLFNLFPKWAAILYFLLTVYRTRRATFWPLHRWAFANPHED
jgi:hypothetical protein